MGWKGVVEGTIGSVLQWGRGGNGCLELEGKVISAKLKWAKEGNGDSAGNVNCGVMRQGGDDKTVLVRKCDYWSGPN